MNILRVSCVVALLVLLSCAVGWASYSESPMLHDKVLLGELPPVEERLPVEPLILEPINEIGQYGGVWRTAEVGYLPVLIALYDPLLRWDDPMARGDEGETAILPNIAKDWDAVDDKEFTFYLRPGMKWSDGSPFTADDILFWFEDVIQNRDITPVIPSWLISAQGELPVFEKIDDYAFSIRYPSPTPLMIEVLAGAWSRSMVATPKHYLQQFHIEYADAIS